ncbi:MAG: CopD family protein [Saprospiraceae bacterium]|nr:CopD family protein [Saprospiraceae bacterium]
MDLSFLLKATHIVGAVAWFAGLFYLLRLFVYHVEALALPSLEKEILVKQYSLMENRVYKVIVNPAMMITFTVGIAMLVYNPSFLSMGWVHIKLTLLILLLVFHIWSKSIMKKIQAGVVPFSSFQLRLLNEVPTVLLVAIVFIAVFRDNINYLYYIASLIIFVVLLYVFAKSYNKK